MAAALLLAMAPAHAQERSAGQSYDAQTNWSALNGRIEAVINQNKMLAQTVDKMKACNDKKMIFVPSDPAADADGCVSALGPGCDSQKLGDYSYRNPGNGKKKTVAITCPVAKNSQLVYCTPVVYSFRSGSYNPYTETITTLAQCVDGKFNQIMQTTTVTGGDPMTPCSSGMGGSGCPGGGSGGR